MDNAPSPLPPRLRLRVYLDDATWIGPGKADLLELIDETGSISQAGRRMGMSYKRAWMLVETLNASFAGPLVVSERGGAGGGGARLTPAGAQVLALFRRIQMQSETAAASDIATLAALRDVIPERK